MRHYKPHANVQFAYWPDVSGATKINREEGSVFWTVGEHREYMFI